ncbi:MAG: hypothetical protein ABI472_23435 [Ginsengibacter sp.]
MIILHAVQKLLKTSGLQPAMYISAPSENQYLHAWYAKLLSTGFPGKLLVMYVHQPSLLLVLTRGRSINTTLPSFFSRLPQLLHRNNFKQEFIEQEIQLVEEGYVISRTNNRSMLGSMNAITVNIETSCRMSPLYELINLDDIEDDYLDWFTLDAASGRYLRTRDYWVERGFIN